MTLHARSFARTYPAVPPISPTPERTVWAPPGAPPTATTGDRRPARWTRRRLRLRRPERRRRRADPGTGHVYSLHVDPTFTATASAGACSTRRCAASPPPATRPRRCGSSPTTSRRGASTNASAGPPDGAVERQSLALDGDGPSAEVVRYRPAPIAAAAGTAPKYYELRQWLRTQVDGMPPGTPGGAGADAQPALQRVPNDRAPGAPRPRRRGADRPPSGPRHVRRPAEGDPTDAAVLVHAGDDVAGPPARVADRRHRLSIDAEPEVADRLGVTTGSAGRAARAAALRRRRADGGRDRVPRPRPVPRHRRRAEPPTRRCTPSSRLATGSSRPAPTRRSRPSSPRRRRPACSAPTRRRRCCC